MPPPQSAIPPLRPAEKSFLPLTEFPSFHASSGHRIQNTRIKGLCANFTECLSIFRTLSVILLSLSQPVNAILDEDVCPLSGVIRGESSQFMTISHSLCNESQAIENAEIWPSAASGLAGNPPMPLALGRVGNSALLPARRARARWDNGRSDGEVLRTGSRRATQGRVEELQSPRMCQRALTPMDSDQRLGGRQLSRSRLGGSFHPVSSSAAPCRILPLPRERRTKPLHFFCLSFSQIHPKL